MAASPPRPPAPPKASPAPAPSPSREGWARRIVGLGRFQQRMGWGGVRGWGVRSGRFGQGVRGGVLWAWGWGSDPSLGLALILSFSHCVTLGKTLPLSDPQLSYKFNETLAKAFFTGLNSPSPPINTHTHMHTHLPGKRVLCIWTPRLTPVQGSILLPPFLALLSGVWQRRGVFTRS